MAFLRNRIVLVFCVVLGSCTTGEINPGKSSSIPERREFPINPDIKPCDDFYGYACSKVVDSFALREDRSSHTFAFSDSSERLLMAKQKFLSELKDKKDLTPRSSELRDVYLACMNEPGRKKEETTLVEATKKRLDAIKKRDEFQKLLTENMTGSEVSFLSYGRIANHDNPDWYDLYFMSRVKTLPEHSYYENKELMAEFRALLVTFYQTIGLDHAEKRADTVIEFESAFMKTYPKPAQMREIMSQKSGVKRDDFQKKYPSFHIDAFFSKVPQFTHVRNLTPDNYKFLSDRLAKMDLESLKDIYLFHELSDYMDDAFPQYYQSKFAFNKKYLGGPNARPPREERCTRMVMHQFTKEIDAELVDIIFPNFPAQKVVNLGEKVRNAIVKGIEQNQWLSKKGKLNAARKIRTADLMLVKPRTDEEWDFNPSIDYSPETPIANQRMLDVKLIEKELRELKSVRNKRKWLMGPLTINAYYYAANNQFVMPLGILQYPFYDPSLPESVNLGAVGAVVGHELGHAIDDKGARFDEKGRLVSILEEADIVEFKKRGSIFIDQFKAVGYDGELTLGENIGDHVGLTFAYDAAFPDPAKADIELKKAYFLQFARVWCYVARPKFKELMMKTDPHPLGEARVNQQVKHHTGFAEAYSCKENDSMVLPKDKRARIW